LITEIFDIKRNTRNDEKYQKYLISKIFDTRNIWQQQTQITEIFDNRLKYLIPETDNDFQEQITTMDTRITTFIPQ